LPPSINFAAKIHFPFLFPKAQRVKKLHLLALLMVGCSLGLGCGAKAKSREPVFKVSGTIDYKGSPVADADITFMCEEKNRSAFGRTNDKGEFKLTTFAVNDGAVPGKHLIMVSKIEAAGPAKEVAEVTSEAYEPPKAGQSTDLKPKNAIPAKYSDAKKTDLFAVVTEGDNPPMKLELTD
jgi:hypothetical protein